mgnify:CR=1 FL=1
MNELNVRHSSSHPLVVHFASTHLQNHHGQQQYHDQQELLLVVVLLLTVVVLKVGGSKVHYEGMRG